MVLCSVEFQQFLKYFPTIFLSLCPNQTLRGAAFGDCLSMLGVFHGIVLHLVVMMVLSKLAVTLIIHTSSRTSPGVFTF
jgi:hypothetical protein